MPKKFRRQARQFEQLRPWYLDLWQFNLRSSEPAEQDQDQHDNENETEAAATVITGAVERFAAEAAKAPEQYDDQNDEQDGSNRLKRGSLPKG